MLKTPGKSKTGTKILLDAMSKDKVHLARFVLDALDGEIVDSKTEGAQTPLISSVLLPEGHVRCKFAELLLERGARVNCQDSDGRTALSHACENGYLDAVKILVRYNADPEIVDSWGNSALMYAAVTGHSAVVDFLVRAFKRLGLQIDRQNKVGNSAVGVAKYLGHTDCISALISKKSREFEEGAERNIESRLYLNVKERGEKVRAGGKLQMCDHPDCALTPNCRIEPGFKLKPIRTPLMGSMEESEREDDSLSPQGELTLSGLLTPNLPSPAPHQPSNAKKLSDRLMHTDYRLPPLKHNPEAPKSLFFSPQPHRNQLKSSVLGILLTPVLSKKSIKKPETEKSKFLDFCGGLRFHDSYYQKRCSLPTSVLSPTPPERTLMPCRKFRTVMRREASPCKAKLPQLTQTNSSKTFSVLSNKLLRRYTSPDIKKTDKDLEEGPVMTPGRIPRSETFPQTAKHPQVGSKSSIDSISSVKCEFDLNFKMLNN